MYFNFLFENIVHAHSVYWPCAPATLPYNSSQMPSTFPPPNFAPLSKKSQNPISASHLGDICISLVPLIPRQGRMTWSQESVRAQGWGGLQQNRRDMAGLCTNDSWSLWLPASKTCTRSSQSKFQRGSGRGSRSPSLAEDLLAADDCWRRGCATKLYRIIPGVLQ